MREEESAGETTLVRVGGQLGKWHSKECVFEDKWIIHSGKQTGMRQRETTGTKITSIIKAGDGDGPVWQKFLYRICFLKSIHWRESSETGWVRWVWFWGASGREKDGLVHFYCRANAPKIPFSSIINSEPPLPRKMPPHPFFSPSKSLSLFWLSLLSVLHCGSSESQRATAHTLKMIFPKDPVLNLIHSPLHCLNLKEFLRRKRTPVTFARSLKDIQA